METPGPSNSDCRCNLPPLFFEARFLEDRGSIQSFLPFRLYSGDTFGVVRYRFVEFVDEAKNIDGEMLGNDRLAQFLREREESTACVLGDAICKLVDDHMRKALQYDDISISVFKKL